MVYLVRAAAVMTIAGCVLTTSPTAARAGVTAAMQAAGQPAATAPGTSAGPAPRTPASPLPEPSAAPASSPSPTPVPSPSSVPENPLVTARVSREFTNWQRGRIDLKSYSPEAGGIYIDAYVNLVSPDLTAIGPLQNITYESASLLLGDLVYRYEITGTMGAVSVLYALDARGKTDGIVFTPLIFRAAPAAP